MNVKIFWPAPCDDDVADDGAGREAVLDQIKYRSQAEKNSGGETAERDADVVVDVEAGHERALAAVASAVETFCAREHDRAAEKPLFG